ncbi:MAG: DUF4115 domain-containing protein [Alphaproteobacteria bacterium]|nr:DUF4115 domain-containing protein [Alphaproteobacteria bacterium]
MVRLNPRSLRVLNQDGATDAMQSVEGADHVGAFLREARETTGRSIADVAQTLRIRRVYLEAIENGRFDELPGAAYAVGFVRSYATYLRLDVPAVVDRFKEEASGIEAPQELDFPTPVPEGRFPGGVLVALCLVVAAAGAGGWYWWQSQKSLDIARVPPPPEVLTGAADTPVDEPAEPAVSPPVVQTTETTAEDPSITEPDVAGPPQHDVVEPAAQREGQVAARAEPDALGPVEDMRVAEAIATSETEHAEREPVQPEDVSPDPETPVTEVPRDYVRPAVDPVAAAADVPDIAEAEREPSATGAAEADNGQESASQETPNVEEPRAAPASATDDTTSETPTQTAGLPAIPATPTTETGAADGRTYGSVNRDARIVLSAREDNTWVQVMDGQENALLTQMLRPGDRYLVPDRPGLSLRTNNAGGLEISVDGAAVPAIGGSGDIRREVRLDPELLKSGSAVIQ